MHEEYHYYGNMKNAATKASIMEASTVKPLFMEASTDCQWATQHKEEEDESSN